jgi:hypothetical protein
MRRLRHVQSRWPLPLTAREAVGVHGGTRYALGGRQKETKEMWRGNGSEGSLPMLKGQRDADAGGPTLSPSWRWGWLVGNPAPDCLLVGDIGRAGQGTRPRHLTPKHPNPMPSLLMIRPSQKRIGDSKWKERSRVDKPRRDGSGLAYLLLAG